MEKIIALVAAVLNALGIDAVIGDNGETPNGLHERVMDRLTQPDQGQGRIQRSGRGSGQTRGGRVAAQGSRARGRVNEP